MPPAADGHVVVTAAIHADHLPPSLAVSAMAFKWFVSSGSSLLSPQVRLLSDASSASTTQATYQVAFTPPAAGTYYVAARLEYTSRERALMDPTCSPGGDVNCFNIGGDKRPEPYRGVQLDGSPLAVVVTQQQLWSVEERPWCQGSLHAVRCVRRMRAPEGTATTMFKREGRKAAKGYGPATCGGAVTAQKDQSCGARQSLASRPGDLR
jgi:hypothetical protein